MNIHVEPVSGVEPSCPVAEPLDTARTENNFRVGEIVEACGYLAVVLPCAAKKGKGRQFFRLMYSEKTAHGYRSNIFFTPKSAIPRIKKLDRVTPTLKLEEYGCHLHALLTTTDAGEVIRECVDLPAFEATLKGWFEALRSIPAGSLDVVLRNILEGSTASARLLDIYEETASASE